MSRTKETIWENLAQPGSLAEWAEIRRVALEKMVGILTNDSPHMSLERAIFIIDSFFCDKMFHAWGTSDSTVVWDNESVERFILEHFTFEFRNNVARTTFAD